MSSWQGFKRVYPGFHHGHFNRGEMTGKIVQRRVLRENGAAARVCVFACCVCTRGLHAIFHVKHENVPRFAPVQKQKSRVSSSADGSWIRGTMEPRSFFDPFFYCHLQRVQPSCKSRYYRELIQKRFPSPLYFAILKFES